jgi:hypothetical protein
MTQSGSTATRLLDNLVGALLKLQRYVEAKRLGGLEIDHQLEFDWKLDGKLRRLCATENAIDIGGGATKYVCVVWSVGKQPAVSGDDGVPIDRRHIASSCQQYNWRTMDERKAIRHGDEAASRLAPKRG